MVRLTMTPSIVEGLQKLAEVRPKVEETETHDAEAEESPESTSTPAAKAEAEPSLDDPTIGNPIAHGQIIDLWRSLKTESIAGFSLEGLLRGAQVYIPPPPPKPEPSDEYKALMARLRREEEERTYQRMLKQPSRMEAFSQQFPNASARTHMFAEVNRPMHESDNGDDEVTLGDVQKQLMVILNFLLSVIGVGATIWIAARWWSLTSRIFLTMGGSILVLIAEVAVYSGYVWRFTEAKTKRREPKEIREVMQTWVVGKEEEDKEGEKDACIQSTVTDGFSIYCGGPTPDAHGKDVRVIGPAPAL
ncbi:vacuolar h+-atpase assembly protein [Colletotrichum karsti]|uniref:Vacuolar h+-atpase assembly protein n=1 Tax=Colletotrichum karsti TaxID=1095194 RepID=A0A9P6LD34_9PEZI|nr:vacuolar h+-atpase assembly protein [Colletotrichum karsti]KAF9870689.1 vacuolar h+-atpase assembly protein [Colletotrichum karsti]